MWLHELRRDQALRARWWAESEAWTGAGQAGEGRALRYLAGTLGSEAVEDWGRGAQWRQKRSRWRKAWLWGASPASAGAAERVPGVSSCRREDTGEEGG